MGVTQKPATLGNRIASLFKAGAYLFPPSGVRDDERATPKQRRQVFPLDGESVETVVAPAERSGSKRVHSPFIVAPQRFDRRQPPNSRHRVERFKTGKGNVNN